MYCQVLFVKSGVEGSTKQCKCNSRSAENYVTFVRSDAVTAASITMHIALQHMNLTLVDDPQKFLKFKDISILICSGHYRALIK